jgi:hypothetical protein
MTRRFEYRLPRLSAGFDVEFIAGTETHHGLCRNVSDDGIRAEFDRSVVMHSEGLLILRPPIGVLKLNALVAYVQNQAAGLIFHFENPWERRMTSEFIANLADPNSPSLVVRIP